MDFHTNPYSIYDVIPAKTTQYSGYDHIRIIRGLYIVIVFAIHYYSQNILVFILVMFSLRLV